MQGRKRGNSFCDFFCSLRKEISKIMSKITSIFGSRVFNDAKMRERLSKETYESLQKTIKEGSPLDTLLLNEIAEAVKNWALEHGATHYTHWFLPLTSTPAEKHDSFIDYSGEDIIAKFTGKTLLKGEPDASSFPSGGLRNTAQARGYTIWDPTSPMYLKTIADRNVLYIPSVFVGYHGEALDRKIPLHRSLNALDKVGKRFMALFGKTDVKRVFPAVGPEQEYFLIDRDLYLKRDDLMYTGRTLFGILPPKGQELEDHYFAPINNRVTAFIKDINDELWSLGIAAKTDHNEVAPLQHETATIFCVGGVATDQNMILMEVLQRTARKHNLVCLLHEKPFASINGSGKHNNWSVNADSFNLTDPTDKPEENLEFLLTMACIIKAIDENAVYLRLSASNPGNDFRLGANEAPPAILSIYLGDQLADIVDQIITTGRATKSLKPHTLDLGIPQIGKITAEATDRNRTSPFAFTGNKFEFRMLASSVCISEANIALNTVIAKEFETACDALEGVTDFKTACLDYIAKTIKRHQRVIFNGNGYSKEWVKEAAKRGLPNVKTYIEAIESLTHPKTAEMFKSLNVMSFEELHCRSEVAYESYAKTINIEALTAISMVNKKYIPAVKKYLKDLGDCCVCSEHDALVAKLLKDAEEKCQKLKSVQIKASSLTRAKDMALEYLNTVVPALTTIRQTIDTLETLVAKDYWPVPDYSDLFIED